MAQDPPLPEQIAHLEDTTSFFHGEYNAQSVAVTVFAALAITSAFELLLLIFTTFRRYGGVYFWSLVVATVGLLPYTLSFMCAPPVLLCASQAPADDKTSAASCTSRSPARSPAKSSRRSAGR